MTPETKREYDRAYRKRNRARINAYARVWSAENPEKRLGYARKRLRGFTQEVFDQLMESQGGCCAICLRPFTKTPHADHVDGLSGPRPRGILCGSCNRGIGLLQHDPAVLVRAAEYVS